MQGARDVEMAEVVPDTMFLLILLFVVLACSAALHTSSNNGDEWRGAKSADSSQDGPAGKSVSVSCRHHRTYLMIPIKNSPV